MARLTDDDISGLLAIGKRMEEAAEAGDGRTLAIVDASLHERIMQLADNRTLLRVWQSLEPLSRTFITLAGPHSDPQWTAGLHDPILDAVRDRDTEGVVRAIEGHFKEIREWLAEHLDDVVEQQDAATPSARTP